MTNQIISIFSIRFFVNEININWNSKLINSLFYQQHSTNAWHNCGGYWAQIRSTDILLVGYTQSTRSAASSSHPLCHHRLVLWCKGAGGGAESGQVGEQQDEQCQYHSTAGGTWFNNHTRTTNSNCSSRSIHLRLRLQFQLHLLCICIRIYNIIYSVVSEQSLDTSKYEHGKWSTECKCGKHFLQWDLHVVRFCPLWPPVYIYI